MITILHISDLHRDSGSALTTESLLESLRLDRERYRAQHRIPDVAIVSGDIVLGVTSNDGDSDVALNRQYEEAKHFLVRLADLFFNGNRERVVIVPGNHDVSHPHVLRATAIETIPTDSDKRAILARQLNSDGSPWRWVWTDFSLRRIADAALYAQRLQPFADFYSAFYEKRRIFSLDPAEQFGVHDFPDLGIVVAGLSSCCDNDLFNRSGRIHPSCVAGVTRAVAEPLRRGRIAIATWHHNLAGGPRDSDYVDADFLQSLLDGGFSIGLHGHQHRPQFLEHRFTANRQRAIAVVSSGTLCGGPRSLPSGRRRAYNLVTINPELRSGTLVVREMKNDGFSSPVWGEAYVTEFGGASIQFDLSLPAVAEPSIQIAAEAAELLRKGDIAGALALARPLATDPLARRVAIEAFVQLADWQGIKEFCTPPQSSTEIVALCDALYLLGDKAALKVLVSSDEIARNTDVAVRQSVEQAHARLGRPR